MVPECPQRSRIAYSKRSESRQLTTSATHDVHSDAVHSDDIEHQEQHISQIIRSRFHFTAKPLQIKAIRRLLYDRADLILVAGTSFGKSLIFQAAPLVSKDVEPMICLIILPLNAIADEQLEKLVRTGAKPVLLNQKTNSKSTRETIANGHATHVLTSPELALSKEFHNDILARNTSFKRRLGLVAIDELHLASQWEEFRPQYGQIHALRIRIGQNIPCVGLSATLSDELLRKVIKSCGFRGDVEILRSSIDRPNIHIQVQPLQHTKKSMDDLCRVLPMQYSGPCSIPKTLIYTQTIAEALQAMTRLRNRTMELGYPTEAAKLVRSFYSTVNDHDKAFTAKSFAQEDSDCTDVRVLCCTDAYGLGIDNPDVKWVIQWLLPHDPEAILQRMGRAVRRDGYGTGMYVLLHEPFPSSETGNVDTDPSEVNKGDKMHPAVMDFIRGTIDGCHRATILKHFGEDMSSSARKLCCSLCNNEDEIEMLQPLVEVRSETNDLDTNPHYTRFILKRLKEWRNNLDLDLGEQRFHWEVQELVSDTMLDEISKYGYNIHEKEKLLGMAKVSHNPIVERHTRDCLEIFKAARDQTKEFEMGRGEAWVLWKAYNDGSKRNKGKHFAREREPSPQGTDAKAIARGEDWRAWNRTIRGEPSEDKQARGKKRARPIPTVDTQPSQGGEMVPKLIVDKPANGKRRARSEPKDDTQPYQSGEVVPLQGSTILSPISGNTRRSARPKKPTKKVTDNANLPEIYG